MAKADVVVDTLDADDLPERSAHRHLERTMSDLPKISVEEPPQDGPTPEQALKDAQAALAAKDKEISDANSARANAERTVAQARDAAARERRGRAGDRKAMVSQSLEGAKSDRISAISAIKTARDAGDFDAEMKAQQMLNSADYRINQSTAELAGMGEGGGDPTSEAGKVREQGGGTGADGRISPAAQDWINKHPDFNRNTTYRTAMLAAHGAAVADGATVDSPAYFRYLNDADTAFRGQNGGGDMGGNRGKQNNGNGNDRFDGAPPQRGGGDGGGGGASGKQVNTLLGPVGVRRLNNGKISIQIPRDLRDNFEEGAKIANMDLGEYALEQVKIAEERAAGGTGGLITTEGQKFS